MKKNITKVGFMLFAAPMILLGSMVHAENIAVGSRALTAGQRAERAIVKEKEATVDIEQNEEAQPKASLFKKFYQLHYGAFHKGEKAAVDGSTLELDDGSVWSLKYVSDMLSVTSWTNKDSLVIEQWGVTGVEYKILNQTRDEYIIASPILGPVFDGIHTHWISAKDSLFGTVTLEDGSEWEAFSSSSFNLWQPNDTIILGAYEFGSVYNTILINVNLLDYARVKLKWVK